jgi:hypothetical protein
MMMTTWMVCMVLLWNVFPTTQTLQHQSQSYHLLNHNHNHNLDFNHLNVSLNLDLVLKCPIWTYLSNGTVTRGFLRLPGELRGGYGRRKLRVWKVRSMPRKGNCSTSHVSVFTLVYWRWAVVEAFQAGSFVPIDRLQLLVKCGYNWHLSG